MGKNQQKQKQAKKNQSLNGRVIVGINFTTLELEILLFHVLRVWKQVKHDSITFSLETSVKGQALDDLFKFNES